MKRILVVDDEVDILDLTRLYLEAAGYLVEAVETGEEALQRIVKGRPDLLLLDVILPGVSGLDVLRRIRGDPRTRSMRVVLFSALGPDVEMMLKPSEAADGYLGKPFSRELLLRRVESALAGGR